MLAAAILMAPSALDSVRAALLGLMERPRAGPFSYLLEWKVTSVVEFVSPAAAKAPHTSSASPHAFPAGAAALLIPTSITRVSSAMS
jgi:hypothetical protein